MDSRFNFTLNKLNLIHLRAIVKNTNYTILSKAKNGNKTQVNSSIQFYESKDRQRTDTMNINAPITKTSIPKHQPDSMIYTSRQTIVANFSDSNVRQTPNPENSEGLKQKAIQFYELMEGYIVDLVSNKYRLSICSKKDKSYAKCASMIKAIHFPNLPDKYFGCVLRMIKEYAQRLENRGVKATWNEYTKSLLYDKNGLYHPPGIHCILHGYITIDEFAGRLGNNM